MKSPVVLRLSAALAALALAAPKGAHACSVCFGDPDSPETKGAKLAIVFLLVVTFGVLGSFGTFFVLLMRRARRLADAPIAEAEAGGWEGRSAATSRTADGSREGTQRGAGVKVS
jgi:hypothetical protein